MSSSDSRPIFTASFVDQAYEFLLEKIISNEIAYGDTLSIKELSAELGISTMPIREAIKRLEYERVVDVKPRSSCQVRVPDKKEMIAIYELREALELFAVRKFLRNDHPAALDDLENITAKMGELSAVKDPELRARRAMELDHSFHRALCALADNEYVDHYYRQLSIHFNMAAIHAATYVELEDRYFESHSAIVECLQRRSDDAVDCLESHFDNVWKLLDDE